MFKKKGTAKENANRINTDGTMKWRKKTSLNARQASMRESMMNMKTSLLSSDLLDMFSACEVPSDMDVRCQDDINAWLAENTVEFFNEAYLHYTMATNGNTEWSELCRNPALHPNKGYPDGVMYLWREVGEKKPTQLPADDYIQRVFVWIEQKIDDENIFPPEEDTPFPHDFRKYLRKIFQRVFRTYLVIYANDCLKANLDKKQLKSSMMFLMYFGWHWELIDFQDQKEAKFVGTLLEPVRRRYTEDREKHRMLKKQKSAE